MARCLLIFLFVFYAVWAEEKAESGPSPQYGKPVYPKTPYPTTSYPTSPHPKSYPTSPYPKSYPTTPYPKSYPTTPFSKAYPTTPYPKAYPTSPYPKAYPSSPYPKTYSSTPYQEEEYHEPTYQKTYPERYPKPSYPQQYAPKVYPQTYKTYEAIPGCARNTTSAWCLYDPEYPTNEIEAAAEEHYEALVSLYADVADLATDVSVDELHRIEEETYLCPSQTAYVRPLRARNSAGKWRVILNNVEVQYKPLTQSVRLEECLATGDSCPLVPPCYESRCLQKSVHHRFVVFDSYDEYYPFSVDSFRLPASCSCLLGSYNLIH